MLLSDEEDGNGGGQNLSLQEEEAWGQELQSALVKEQGRLNDLISALAQAEMQVYVCIYVCIYTYTCVYGDRNCRVRL